MTIGEFELNLKNARCEADCERLLRIDLHQVECTERKRDDLAGKALARRFHFALTAEGVPPVVAAPLAIVAELAA